MSVNNAIHNQGAVSDATLYAEEIAYFDTHDLSEDLKNGPEVQFEVSPRARRKRYPLERGLSDKVESIARQRGVSAETLLNLWIQEKAAETLTAGAAE